MVSYCEMWILFSGSNCGNKKVIALIFERLAAASLESALCLAADDNLLYTLWS